MTDTNIPDYAKVTLINDYLESIEKLEKQIVDSEERLVLTKKNVSSKLETDCKRIEYQIKKEKDSLVTKKEIESYRKKESKEYSTLEGVINETITNFVNSDDYIGFLSQFYDTHKDDIVEKVINKELAKKLKLSTFTESTDQILFRTQDVDYDFSNSIISNLIAKYLLTQ